MVRCTLNGRTATASKHSTRCNRPRDGGDDDDDDDDDQGGGDKVVTILLGARLLRAGGHPDKHMNRLLDVSVISVWLVGCGHGSGSPINALVLSDAESGTPGTATGGGDVSDSAADFEGSALPPVGTDLIDVGTANADSADATAFSCAGIDGFIEVNGDGANQTYRTACVGRYADLHVPYGYLQCGESCALFIAGCATTKVDQATIEIAKQLMYTSPSGVRYGGDTQLFIQRQAETIEGTYRADLRSNQVDGGAITVSGSFRVCHAPDDSAGI
jgi:hypothetical protein